MDTQIHRTSPSWYDSSASSPFCFLVSRRVGVIFFRDLQTVTIGISITAGFFVIVHLTLTVLACLRLNCTHRTPLSEVRWNNGEQLGYV